MSHNPTNPSLLVGNDELAQYCKRNHIEFITLDNGVRIVAVSLRNPESVNVEMHCHFAAGSYFDPQSKLGLHHFLEHLINKPIRDIAQTRDVDLNASTSFFEMSHHASGPLTTRVDDYGILDMIPHVHERLVSIVDGYDDLESVIESERHVIQNEIDKYNADHGWVAMQHIKRDLLGPNHPLLIETAGTTESLAGLTKDDFIALSKELATSSILTIEAKNIGLHPNSKPLIESIERAYKRFPTSNLSRTIDWTILDQHAPLPNHQTFVHQTGLHNNLSSIAFSWLVDSPELTARAQAFDLYRDYVQERIHKYSREQGIGYMAAIMHYQTPGKRMILIRFDTSNHDQATLESMTSRIEKDLVTSLLPVNTSDVATILKTHKQRQLTVPFSSAWHHSWAMYGLERFGAFVDGAKIREQADQINATDIEYWGHLMTTTAANSITIVGDFA